MFAGDSLVLGLHSQLVPGRCVVQTGGTLGDGVQVDGLDGSGRGEDSPGPRGLEVGVARRLLARWLNLRRIPLCVNVVPTRRSHQ